jgi:hypothetical protein
MSRLMKLTALTEAATGLALLALPSFVVRLPLGAEISGASIPSVASRELRCSRSVSPTYDGSPQNEAMDSNQMSSA